MGWPQDFSSVSELDLLATSILQDTEIWASNWYKGKLEISAVTQKGSRNFLIFEYEIWVCEMLMKFLDSLESLGSDRVSALQVQLLSCPDFVITDSMDTEIERAKSEIKDKRKCFNINWRCSGCITENMWYLS